MDNRSENRRDEAWLSDLKGYLQPEWDALVAGEFATGVINGTWPIGAMRGWLLQLYPFIHAFPKYLAEALIKTED